MNTDISTINRRLPEFGPDPGQDVRFAGLEFDSRRQELRRNGVPIALRPKPLALLRYLLAHPGRLLGKQELISALWGGTVVTDDSLVQCVGELRNAIGDREQRLIRTLPRRGYLFDAQIEPATPAGSPQLQAPDVLKPTARPSIALALRWRRWLIAGLCLIALTLGGAAWLWRVQAPVGQLNIDAEMAARRAVAVLPPTDPGTIDGGVSTLGAAVADAIVTHASLRSRPASSVVGRASTGAYSPESPDVARMGRELKVKYVVSGRVQRQDGRVEIVTQVTSVDTGQVLTLDQSSFPSDAAALQSNVGARIAAALRTRFPEFERARFTGTGTGTSTGPGADPVDLALAGWRDINRFITREDLERGRQRLESAGASDSRSVMVAQGMGVTYLVEFAGLMSPSPARTLDLAEQHLKKALDLDPNLQENLAAWGDVLRFRGQLQAAETVARRVLDGNPRYATAQLSLAAILIRQGRVEEAQSWIDKVQALQSTDLRLMRALYGASLDGAFTAGNDAQAREWAGRWIAQYPTSGWPWAAMAALEALAGRDDEAAAAMARHRALLPDSNLDYVRQLRPSDSPRYRAATERLLAGLRKAGLPEH